MTRVLLDLSLLATETRQRGIGRYAADLARGLAELAPPDLQLIALEHLGMGGASRSGTDVLQSLATLAEAEAISHYRWAYALRLGFARAARSAGADVAHTPHPNATPLGRISAARVTTCHDLIPLRWPKHYLDYRDGYRVGREQLDRRRYRVADHVIAVSEATADDLVSMLDVPPAKITVVHNGVRVEFWSAGEDSDAEQLAALEVPAAPFVLCAGPPEWRKNPENMLQAFAMARRSCPELELVWVSGLSPVARARIAAIAGQYGVAEHVRFTGYVRDETLRALYRRARALLFVSRAEGFGYPMVEAMAAGCPVITGNASSCAEIAVDAAHLVDPERADGISSAIMELVRNDTTRRNAIESGRTRAQVFTMRAMAEQTADVYRRASRA
jgi:glycosyltransferase involved in cell wall biosynthesis